MSVNPKHDRQGVRTAVDIERKYSLGDTAEAMSVAANAQRAATNAQSVASEANATATRANTMAVQANETATQANEMAVQVSATAEQANTTAEQANTTAEQANTTAEQANETANTANAAAAAAQAAVTTLSENVYTKEQTLSSEIKTQLGLSDTATPSDAFAALNQGSGGGTSQYTAGDNISIVDNVISVTTTDAAESGNTLPITSAGVYALIGDIETLLSTI